MEVKISKRLKELRKAKTLNQREIAKAIGVSQNSYCLWETGRTYPTPENLMELCKYFDVSADYLLGLTDTI